VPPDEVASPSDERWTPREVESEAEEEAAPSPSAVQPASDAWTSLFQAGMALLQQFAGGSVNGPAPRSLVQRDDRTGETYLKLPVPPPEVLDQALQAFGALLQSLRK
jgi:hypothetical protein